MLAIVVGDACLHSVRCTELEFDVDRAYPTLVGYARLALRVRLSYAETVGLIVLKISFAVLKY